MANLAELIDQGIKAFTRGLHADAERFWREALELDPGNERVRSYLNQLRAAAETKENAAAKAAEPAQPGRTAPSERAPEAAPAKTAAVAVKAATGWSRGARAAASPEGSADFAPSPWDDGPAFSASIVLDSEGGLDLDAISEKSEIKSLVPEPMTPGPQVGPKSDVDVWMEGARELFALGDFSGSLEMIEKILKVDGNHAEARAYLRQNEATLVAMYESKLGSLSNVPRLAIKPEEVMWLNLDHRAGFLLAQIDGSVNFEDLFALSGLPRLDTAKILAQLLADGVIRSRAQ